MEALELLDIADVIAILERLRLVGAAGDAAALAPSRFQADGCAEIALGLLVGVHELVMERAHEVRGLAQDRDDARVRSQLCDVAGGRPRAQVLRRGVADALVIARGGKQRLIGLERPRRARRRCGARTWLCVQVGREELRLLRGRQEDFGVKAQHFVDRRRA